MPNMRTYPQKARDRIKASLIINKLVDHVAGKIELSSTQVASARILLNKVLPDLKATEVRGRIETVPLHMLSDEQLMAIAAGGELDAIEGQCEAVQEPLKLAGNRQSDNQK